jgi:hypothetical protein
VEWERKSDETKRKLREKKITEKIFIDKRLHRTKTRNTEKTNNNSEIRKKRRKRESKELNVGYRKITIEEYNGDEEKRRLEIFQ